MSAFYVGSCRYQRLIPNHFPPRLHTTAEVLNFLKKYVNNTLEITDNIEFGDALHPTVINDSYKFIAEKPLTSQCKKFFMEICSNKVGYRGGNPVNAYASAYNSTNIIIKLQMIDDIRKDIIEIKELLATHFNIHDIYIITHISMPLMSGEYIRDREEVVSQLRTLTDIVNVIDVSATMMTHFSHLEDALPDSYHPSDSAYIILSKIT